MTIVKAAAVQISPVLSSKKSRGHYARPELLSLLIDRTQASPIQERGVRPVVDATRAGDAAHTIEIV